MNLIETWANRIKEHFDIVTPEEIIERMKQIENNNVDSPVYCNSCGLPKYNCCCEEDSE